MINEEEMERALRWLARTDIAMAEKRVAVLRADYLATVARSLAYRQLEGTGSIEDRKRALELEPQVQAAMEKSFAAVLESEILRGQRKSAELLIETWRSVNANQRKGNI
jgi:hypothetical protein